MENAMAFVQTVPNGESFSIKKLKNRIDEYSVKKLTRSSIKKK